MKKALSLLLSFVMIISLISGVDVISYASTYDNPIILQAGDNWKTGKIYPGKEGEFFKIKLPKDGVVTLDIMSYTSVMWGGFYQYSDSEEIQDYWFNNGSESFPDSRKLKYSLSKGEYFVHLGISSENPATYKIKYSFNAYNNNETEPNDYDRAMVLQPDNIVTGAFTYQDSSDCYKIVLPQDLKIEIKIESYVSGALYGGLYNGNLSHQYADYWFNCGNETTPDSRVLSYSLKKGTYILKLCDYTIQVYGGKYRVSYRILSGLSTPSNLKISVRNTNSLKLTWNKVSNAKGYELQQKSGNTWKTKVTTTSTSTTVSKLSAGYNYAFRVRAYRIISGKKYYSNWKNITACTKPATAKLSGLTAYSNHKIKVSWKKVSGYASGYQIYWAKDKNFKKIVSKTTISGQSKTTYTGKNFSKGKRYYVKVRAYRTVNGTKYYGSWSNVKSIVSK